MSVLLSSAPISPVASPWHFPPGLGFSPSPIPDICLRPPTPPESAPSPTITARPGTPHPFASFSFEQTIPRIDTPIEILISPTKIDFEEPSSPKSKKEDPSTPRPSSPSPYRQLAPNEARQLSLLLTQHFWPNQTNPKTLMKSSIDLAEKLHEIGIRWDRHRRIMGTHLRTIWQEGKNLPGPRRKGLSPME
jgi:hypothetical protein